MRAEDVRSAVALGAIRICSANSCMQSAATRPVSIQQLDALVTGAIAAWKGGRSLHLVLRRRQYACAAAKVKAQTLCDTLPVDVLRTLPLGSTPRATSTGAQHRNLRC